MEKKCTVGIVMGGKSSEHKVSLLSARNIIEALDKTKYNIVPIGIDKDGTWHHMHGEIFTNPDNPELIALGDTREKYDISNHSLTVVFPIIHGTTGEDGALQGLFTMYNTPFVGPDICSSALCFDKDMTKKILSAHKIRTSDSITIHKDDIAPTFKSVTKELGNLLFIKPARQGSSVGVHRVTSADEFAHGLRDAFHHDSKVLIERSIAGRELECAVLGNKNPQASTIGEVIVTGKHEFYSYDSKYIDENGSHAIIPADVSSAQMKNLQEVALRTYKALGCTGMARIDMFLTQDDIIYINEINTIPGFTNISMYPKLWEASGMPYSDLLDTLIQLAIDQ
jgi:D-alanine-D-alanine ligase